MTRMDIIKQLKEAGLELNRIKGSHHIYTHPVQGGHVCVPHPKKDLGTDLVKKLMKQAKLL